MRAQEKVSLVVQSSRYVYSPGWWVNIYIQNMYTYLKIHGTDDCEVSYN